MQRLFYATIALFFAIAGCASLPPLPLDESGVLKLRLTPGGDLMDVNGKQFKGDSVRRAVKAGMRAPSVIVVVLPPESTVADFVALCSTFSGFEALLKMQFLSGHTGKVLSASCTRSGLQP